VAGNPFGRAEAGRFEKSSKYSGLIFALKALARVSASRCLSDLLSTDAARAAGSPAGITAGLSAGARGGIGGGGIVIVGGRGGAAAIGGGTDAVLNSSEFDRGEAPLEFESDSSGEFVLPSDSVCGPEFVPSAGEPEADSNTAELFIFGLEFCKGADISNVSCQN